MFKRKCEMNLKSHRDLWPSKDVAECDRILSSLKIYFHVFQKPRAAQLLNKSLICLVITHSDTWTNDSKQPYLITIQTSSLSAGVDN